MVRGHGERTGGGERENLPLRLPAGSQTGAGGRLTRSNRVNINCVVYCNNNNVIAGNT